MVWRRVRDSNPRFLLREHIISSDAPSTSRTTLRAIFQPNFSNLNLGKWREKLERKLFNLFNCTAKTPINQGFSRRGFQSDHWFSSQPRYDHFDTSPYMSTRQGGIDANIQLYQNSRRNSGVRAGRPIFKKTHRQNLTAGSPACTLQRSSRAERGYESFGIRRAHCPPHASKSSLIIISQYFRFVNARLAKKRTFHLLLAVASKERSVSLCFGIFEAE